MTNSLNPKNNPRQEFLKPNKKDYPEIEYYSKIFTTFDYTQYKFNDYENLFAQLYKTKTFLDNNITMMDHVAINYKRIFSNDFKDYMISFLMNTCVVESKMKRIMSNNGFSLNNVATNANDEFEIYTEFNDIVFKTVTKYYEENFPDSNKDELFDLCNQILSVDCINFDSYLNYKIIEFNVLYKPYSYELINKLNEINDLFRIPNAKKLFQNKKFWGLEDNKDDSKNKTVLSLKNICVTRKRDKYNYFTTMDNLFDIFLVPRVRHQEILRDFDFDPLLTLNNPKISAKEKDIMERGLREKMYKKLMEVNVSTKNFSKTLIDIVSVIIKDPASKQNFLHFLLNLIESNRERLKIRYELSDAISDGYAFNMTCILTHFSKKIAINNLQKLINIPALIEYGFFEDDNNTDIIYLSDNIKTEKSNSNVDVNNLSFTTIIFFAQIMFIRYSILKYIENCQDIHRSTENITVEELKNPIIKKIMQGWKSQLNFYCILLNNPFCDDLADFCDFMILFALDLYNNNKDKYQLVINLKDAENIKVVPLKYNILPGYYYDVVFGLIKNSENLKFNKKNFLELITLLLGDNSVKSHIKSECIDALNTCKKGVKNQISKRLFQNLQLYYIQIEEDVSVDMKYIPRSTIIELMLEDTRNNIRNLTVKNKDDLKFMNLFIGNLENIIIVGLSAIKILKEKSDPDYIKKLNEDDKIKNERLLNRQKNMAKHTFACLKNELKLLININKENDILSHELLINTFISILNSNLRTLTGPKIEEINIKDKSLYNFEPKEMLILLMENYIVLNRRTKDNRRFKFIKAIAEDDICFRIEYLDTAIKVCKNKNLFGGTNLENINNFREDIQNQLNMSEKNSEIEIEKEVPLDLLDPLMGCVMENPVILKTSGVTVDKSTFDGLMMSTMIDPFNREKLTEDGYEENVELKKMYEEWSK